MLEFLANNLRWCFMTIRACIEKGGVTPFIDEQLYGQEQEENSESEVLDKLSIFGPITEQIVLGLDSLNQKKQESNIKYYRKTLTNLLDKLFHPADDEEEGIDRKGDDMMGNNQKSLLNVMKKMLYKRDQIYQEVDRNSQSYKSFINLLNSHELFKELKSDTVP